MASSGKNKEKFTILEEIYHEDTSQKKTSAQSTKEYFQDRRKMETLLSVAIIFVGLAGLLLGFFHIKNSISEGTRLEISQKEDGISGYDPNDLLGLKNKDTDQDGLSDYDELNIYNTSPYLADTDSDGMTDKAEVDTNDDPNCPVGQDCFSQSTTLLEPDLGPESESAVEIGTLFFSGQITPAQLRQLLADTGIPQEQLDAVSDQELMEAYRQTISQQSSDFYGGEETEIVPSTDSGQVVDEIRNLTPNQIRQLLAENGVPEEILDSITDKELIDLIEETLGGY